MCEHSLRVLLSLCPFLERLFTNFNSRVSSHHVNRTQRNGPTSRTKNLQWNLHRFCSRFWRRFSHFIESQGMKSTENAHHFCNRSDKESNYFSCCEWPGFVNTSGAYNIRCWEIGVDSATSTQCTMVMCVRPHGANDVQLQCGLKKKKKSSCKRP